MDADKNVYKAKGNTMKLEIKRAKENGMKVVKLYVNGVLFSTYVDKVTLIYTSKGASEIKVVEAEKQAAAKMHDIYQRHQHSFKYVI